MKRCAYACQGADHSLSRRAFLGAGLGGLLGPAGLPSFAAEIEKTRKRMIMICLHGGSSQLETWDPKPNTPTGGPFRAIPTSVPGVHISELLPQTAKQMHRMALVRGLNTADDDHGRGMQIMLTGRRIEPGMNYPEIGAVTAKLLEREGDDLPGHFVVAPGGSGFNKADAAFLDSKYASVMLGDGKPPADLFRPGSLAAATDAEREALRKSLNDKFAKSRRTALTDAYAASFDQAAKVVAKADIFDVSKEDPKIAERYGKHDLGRHMLVARRLLEHGVSFVKVAHSNYDTHHENFDFHIEQMGEFDQPFATLLDDLAERGLLDSTLVVVMSEFGRTPRINHLLGRDHWSKAWSVALAGCGLQRGAVVGKTNAQGTAVTDREVGAGHLFHTYLRALGLNPTRNFYPKERPIPIGDPKAEAIQELLA